MELFYKLLCFVGLAKIHNFKTKFGSFTLTQAALIDKAHHPFFIFDQLKKHGAPVYLGPIRGLPLIRNGYVLQRNDCDATMSVEFVWYRKDYRYVLHPALRSMGCK